MRTINTSSGPKEYDPTQPGHVVNTSRVVEEDLRYEDEEPEILAVIPGTGWIAVAADKRLPLVAFVALDDASMYGVAIGKDGRIDLTESVEECPGFKRYEQVSTNHKEDK